MGQVGSEKQERCHSGVTAHSAVDDSLQSVSHQLANNQSIPLMIFNHSGTGRPAVTNTLSIQKSERYIKADNKLDTTAALNFRATFQSWQQKHPQRTPLVYLYFTSEMLVL